MSKILKKEQELFLSLRNNLLRLVWGSYHKKLAGMKLQQLSLFYNLRKRFLILYKNLIKNDIGRYMTSRWLDYNNELEKAFLPYPPFSFLKNPFIMYSMFPTSGGGLFRSRIACLEKSIPKKELTRLLEEDYVGDPLLVNSDYITSYNTVDLLYHIMKFEKLTRCSIKKINTIVEWGGGYGNMAKIFKRLQPQCTYVIIDSPMVSCIQWLYLSTILGEDKVNLISDKNSLIKSNSINILPLGFLKNYKLKPDLFVSTWALSESSTFSQDYVFGKKWFGAEHLLIAYQRDDKHFVHANRVEDAAKRDKVVIYNVHDMPNNYYAFR